MKVKSLIEMHNEKDILHFGSGTGYVMICEKEKAIEEMVTADKEYHRRIKKSYINALDRFEGYKNALPVYEKRIEFYKKLQAEHPEYNKDNLYYNSERGRYEPCPMNKIDYYNHLIIKAKDKIKKLPEIIADIKTKLDNYVPMLDREVKDTYKLFSMEDAYAIIFEGDEQGDYWFLEEVMAEKQGKKINTEGE